MKISPHLKIEPGLTLMSGAAIQGTLSFDLWQK
jgi:hypothetical protein